MGLSGGERELAVDRSTRRSLFEAGNEVTSAHIAWMAGGHILLVRAPQVSDGDDEMEIWFAHKARHPSPKVVVGFFGF